MTLDFSRRRRRWILLLAAVGFSGYGAYKVYHLPSVAAKRKKLSILIRAMISIAEASSSSAEAFALVSSDLNRFIRSDCDEIPASVKQISKIVKSDEFSGSLSRVSEAMTVGILRGFRSEPLATTSGFSDKLLDKLFSAAGSGFVSAVVGSFARNTVLAFYSDDRAAGVSHPEIDSPAEPGWVNLICSDRSRELIADCIQLFVSTAVAVYLDKTMEINAYDEIFSGLTNPKHEPKVKDFLVSVCNGAVETLVKTSHHVLTASNSSSSGSESSKREAELSRERDRSSFDCKVNNGGGGWIDQVSSTLAIPSNKRFVLDVTGRVTFETVRSFLDFLLSKLYDGARKGVHVVRDEVAERGLEVVRFVSAKSMAVVTICLTLCLHVLMSTRFLMPA